MESRLAMHAPLRAAAAAAAPPPPDPIVSIGGVRLDGRAALAPLAGMTDPAFRLVCRQQGAAMTTTEMVSAEGLVRGCRRTAAYLRFDPAERPVALQIFGSDPRRVARAACIAVDRAGPDLIDLNFGCPVRKIVRKGAGAACLREPGLAGEIVRETAHRAGVPVTAKIRSGWERPDVVRLVRELEEAGAAAVTVHGRTRAQGYAGRADWGAVREAVRAARSLRVIGNGDLASAREARARLRETGCDLVMIGRGALGRPWIFRRLQGSLAPGGGEGAGLDPDPPPDARIRILIRHYELALTLKGRLKGVWDMRRHVAAYTRGLPGREELLESVKREEDPDRVLALLREMAARLGGS